MKITPRPFVARTQSIQAIIKADNDLDAKEREAKKKWLGALGIKDENKQD